MQFEFNFTVAGINYLGKAKRADWPWGNGLHIKTFDARGIQRDSIKFFCHPEFDGFDELQRKTTDELLALATEILISGQLEKSLRKIRPYGLTLYFRLNGREQERPNCTVQ